MINEGVKYFCKDDISLIENYDKAISDQTQTWHCHHRREITTPKKQLLELGEYYQRPASELIFLTPFEHIALHKKGNKNSLGKHHSEEHKRKISEAMKGKNKGKTPWIKGKHFSEEAKKKLSESLKGKTPWNKGKQLSEEAKRKISESLKGKHHNEETKLKMSEARKGLLWFNNGIINIKVKECPEGFVRGRINLKKYEKRQ